MAEAETDPVRETGVKDWDMVRETDPVMVSVIVIVDEMVPDPETDPVEVKVPVTVPVWDMVPVPVWDGVEVKVMVEEAVRVVERDIELELVIVMEVVMETVTVLEVVTTAVPERETETGAVDEGDGIGGIVLLIATPEERTLAVFDIDAATVLERDNEPEPDEEYDPELVTELLRETVTEPELVALMEGEEVAAAVVAAFEEAKRANKATINMTNLYIIEL